MWILVEPVVTVSIKKYHCWRCFRKPWGKERREKTRARGPHKGGTRAGFIKVKRGGVLLGSLTPGLTRTCWY